MRLLEYLRDVLGISSKGKASTEWKYVGYIKKGNEGGRLAWVLSLDLLEKSKRGGSVRCNYLRTSWP